MMMRPQTAIQHSNRYLKHSLKFIFGFWIRVHSSRRDDAVLMASSRFAIKSHRASLSILD